SCSTVIQPGRVWLSETYPMRASSAGPSAAEGVPSTRAPARRLEYVHEHLDRGRLARAVRPEKGKDAAARNLQSQAAHRLGSPEAPSQPFGLDDRFHGSSFHCRRTASSTSRTSSPRFLASTTRRSTSAPSNAARCSSCASGACATTVPIPGSTRRRPWATRLATTLWAVFGLIRSPWLRVRTDGNR